jgi:hypothetical protein
MGWERSSPEACSPWWWAWLAVDSSLARRWKVLMPQRLAEAATLATAFSAVAVRFCESAVLGEELNPEVVDDTVSRRPKKPREMEPVWAWPELLVDEVGDCGTLPLLLWLPIEAVVFRRAWGVFFASFSVSVASLDELDEEWRDDFEVT